MNIITQKTGWIEIICGGMFSGKSEELIRRVRRTQYARQKIQVFKPSLDNRYADEYVVSHSQMKLPSLLVTDTADIRKLLEEDTQVIAIDEVQFFDADVIALVSELADKGSRVILAGLDMDYRGKPFGPMPHLLAIADYVTKLQAICVKCGNPAGRTQRLSHDKEQIVVGADNIYEARCRDCHEVWDDIEDR